MLIKKISFNLKIWNKLLNMLFSYNNGWYKIKNIFLKAILWRCNCNSITVNNYKNIDYKDQNIFDKDQNILYKNQNILYNDWNVVLVEDFSSHISDLNLRLVTLSEYQWTQKYKNMFLILILFIIFLSTVIQCILTLVNNIL